jgi:hypothetical protein
MKTCKTGGPSSSPPGLISSSSFAIVAVPSLGDERGYEDWCLLEGSWAIDPLNGFAITGPRQPSHDYVAAQMAEGAGGLHTYAGGEIAHAAVHGLLADAAARRPLAGRHRTPS